MKFVKKSLFLLYITSTLISWAMEDNKQLVTQNNQMLSQEITMSPNSLNTTSFISYPQYRTISRAEFTERQIEQLKMSGATSRFGTEGLVIELPEQLTRIKSNYKDPVYHNNLRIFLNKLQITSCVERNSSALFNTQSVAEYHEVEIIPLESLILEKQNKEFEKILEKQNKEYQENLVQEKKNGKNEAIDNLPFYQRNAKLCIGLSFFGGGAMTLTVVYGLLHTVGSFFTKCFGGGNAS